MQEAGTRKPVKNMDYLDAPALSHCGERTAVFAAVKKYRIRERIIRKMYPQINIKYLRLNLKFHSMNTHKKYKYK